MSEIKLEWSENEDGEHVAEHYRDDDDFPIEITVSDIEIKLSEGSLTVTVDSGDETEAKRIAELWLPHFCAFTEGLNAAAKQAKAERNIRLDGKP